MTKKYLFYVLVFLFLSCAQNRDREFENTQRKIDSLSNELKRVKENSNSNTQNKSFHDAMNDSNINSSQENIMYGFVMITFEKRFFTIKGDLGAYTISEDDGLRQDYIPDKVEIEKKIYLSDIEEIYYFNDDITYKMLDKYEQVLRKRLTIYDPKHNEFSFKILKREIKTFNSYAKASQAISQFKGISD